MTRSARIYDFSLTAGQSKEILAEGSYYRILTSTGAVEVRRDGGSMLGPIYAGQGERAEFKRLQLRDLSGAGNVGLVIIADDSFIDDRITGEVSVIDGGKSRTLAGQAFFGYANGTAAAANYMHAQLWNPAGSGKNVIVKSIGVSCATAQAVQIRTLASAMTLSGGNAANKRAGGPSSSAEVRNQVNATILGTTPLATILVTANTMFSLTFAEPVVLVPGYGLHTNATVVNTDLPTNYEFIEEAA